MIKLMIFAGTTEGRELCERCLTDKRLIIDAYVATEPGRQYLPKGQRLTAHVGRLDSKEIAAEIRKNNPDIVIDATHPYAEEITKNLVLATNTVRVRYIRLIRHELPRSVLGIYARDYAKAVKIVNRSKGNILITTGSKYIERYSAIANLAERACLRMLPSEENLKAALAVGFKREHIILDKGPFTVEQNVELIKKFNIKYLITKDTGEAGGFPEKEEACRRCNAALVVIAKPVEKGREFEQVWDYIQHKANQKKVAIIGVGMGNPANMTLEAAQAIKNAEAVIGSERLLKGLDTMNKAVYTEYNADKIADFIKNSDYTSYAAVFSGDMCLYSGGIPLADRLADEDYSVSVYQGISSVAYLASRLNLNWAKAKIASLHGTDEDVVRLVHENKSLYLLTGGNISEICKRLCDAGLNNVKVCVGERLSYYDERLVWGYPQDFLDKKFDTISTVYIENDSFGKPVVPILRDEELVRAAGVPMTKRDIRCIVVDRLHLSTADIAYDIGAGTGAVSADIARRLEGGRLYSFEVKPEAVAVLQKNKEKLALDNMEIIEGDALQTLDNIPSPQTVFIGGSNGELVAILDRLLEKRSSFRLVLTAVVLETALEAMRYLKEKAFDGLSGFENTEITQINIANGKNIGERTMLTAQNPIFVISADYILKID